MANITPVYKSAALTDASNYKPISIVPVVSKVLEKVIANQLMIYLENNQFYHSKQFGFCKKWPTEMALCHFIERVKCSLDNGKEVGTVFLDLSKTGLPQGSVMGPILFLLRHKRFALHLHRHWMSYVCWWHSILCFSKESLSSFTDLKQTDGYCFRMATKESLNTESQKNSINVKKKESHRKTAITIDTKEIEVVNEFKYLGVVLDPQLKEELNQHNSAHCTV